MTMTMTTSGERNESSNESAERYIVTHVAVLDLRKFSHDGISTGIGFLNHMLDQFNSHAQVGVAVTVDLQLQQQHQQQQQQQQQRNPKELNGLANENSENHKNASNYGNSSMGSDARVNARSNRGGDSHIHDQMAHTNRFADGNQEELVRLVGREFGKAIAKLLKEQQQSNPTLQHSSAAVSRFCCPLDEALVECILTYHKCCDSVLEDVSMDGVGATTHVPSGSLVKFTLPPYGKYPSPNGRSALGKLQTITVEGFFSELAKNSGLQVSLRKVRGDNGHHIVEAAFKAFSRALRNLLDGTNTSATASSGNGPNTTLLMWGRESEAFLQSRNLKRSGQLERKTKETKISVDISLHDGSRVVSVSTGLGDPILDQFWTTLAIKAQMSLQILCQGDVWIDDHHSAEDVAIAVGQCLNKALGTKAGLNRMWSSTATHGDAVVEATIDLSNRPCLTENLSLYDEEYIAQSHFPNPKLLHIPPHQRVPLLTTEMMHHVLESLVMNAMMTVHIFEHEPGSHVLDRVLATAQAMGEALYYCTIVDPRRAGATASTKGTLSM